MTGRSLLAATAALVLLTGTPVPVGAQPSPARAPRIIEAAALARAEVGGPAFVGVLGEVAMPGTYSFHGERLVLGDVLDRAGGTTERASGTIRVVRNGRAGQQLYRATSLDFPLLAGDLLVVDGRSRSGRFDAPHMLGAAPANAVDDPPSGTATVIRGNGRPVVERGAADELSSAPVQLAFLDLLDRPVVLKMRVEHATLTRIVALLGQSPEVVSTVRVIETGPSRALVGTNEPENVALLSGTILVFDRRAIDRSRLPDLPGPDLAPAPSHVDLAPAPMPAPFRPIDPVPVQVATNDSSSTTPAYRGLGERPPIPRALAVVPPSGPPRIIGPVPPSSGAPPSLSVPPSRLPSHDADVIRAAAPTVTEPPRGPEVPSRAGVDEPVATSTGPAPRAIVGPSGPAAERDAHVAATAPSEPQARGAQEAGGPNGAVRMLGLALVIVAATGTLAWSMFRSEGKVPGLVVRRSARDPLDELIADRIPAVTEALVLPERISFYGRPATLRHLRMDAAHETHGPPAFDAMEATPAPDTRPTRVRTEEPVRVADAARDESKVGLADVRHAASRKDDSHRVVLEELLAESAEDRTDAPSPETGTEPSADPAANRRRQAPRGPHFLGRTHREALSVLEAAFASAGAAERFSGTSRPEHRARSAAGSTTVESTSSTTALEQALSLLQAARAQRRGQTSRATGEGRP